MASGIPYTATMQSVEVAVTVGPRDTEELQSLCDSFDPPGHLMESRALDGQTVATALLVVTPAAVRVLRTWLLTRSANRRTWTVSFDGNTFQGYSSDEVAKLIAAIESKIESAIPEEPQESADSAGS